MKVEISNSEKEVLLLCIKMSRDEGFFRFNHGDTKFHDQINTLKTLMKKLKYDESQINKIDY